MDGMVMLLKRLSALILLSILAAGCVHDTIYVAKTYEQVKYDALTAQSIEVKRIAISVLEACPDEIAVPSLIAVILSADSPEVVDFACSSLRRINSSEHLVRAMFLNSSDPMRHRLALAISTVDKPTLVLLLRDQRWEVRYRAVKMGLGKYDAILQEHLRDEKDLEVQKLSKMLGVPVVKGAYRPRLTFRKVEEESGGSIRILIKD